MACEPEAQLTPPLKGAQPKGAPQTDPDEKRPQFHHGSLRQAALTAARQVVEGDGAGALTLREVARLTGVNHRALYRHFADRDDLVAALAADGFHRLRDSLNAAESGAGSANAVFAGYVRFALDNPALYGLMFSMSGQAFLRHPVLAPAVAGVTDLCQTAFRRPDDPPGFSQGLRDRVMAAWGQAHGLVDLWLRGALRARSREEALDYIVGLLEKDSGSQG